MADYLLIESRDPFTSRDVDGFWDLARDLVADGHAVTLFLVQNGVLAARNQERLGELAQAGVEVLADDFSLQERGIAADRLTGGVRPAPLSTVIDQLGAGRRALWH